MSSFSGRVTFEGDRTTGGRLLADAIHYAEKLSAWKQTTGLSNVSRTYDLGNGSFAVINDLEHLKSIYIVATPNISTSKFEEFFPYNYSDNLGVMDVISGMVISPVIDVESVEVQRNGETVQEEVNVLRRFTPTDRVSERHSDLMCRRRLGVLESPIFAATGGDPSIVYSEHAHVKPSCYSGAMRKVVQLLLGVGKVVTPTWEERWIEDNNKRKMDREIVVEEGSVPVYTTSAFGLYHESNQNTISEVQLRYDYRSFKTHGISFDSTGVPWVVQISSRGLLVMPLYMDPVSLAYEGRQRYLDVNPELSEFFDEFGGFPLGVPFPVGETLDAYIRAGEIVELISSGDIGAFYNKIPYSTATGWCFNSRGSEAHNTCYNYDGEGIGVGYHYAISINLSGETLPEWTQATGTMASLLGLSKIYEIKKARRMDDGTAEGIIEMIKDGDFESAKEAFDDAVVEATLGGTANISMARSGRLYHPAKFKYQPQIKFSEPAIGGLMSHDFGPLNKTDKLITCNTPMFVFFVDDAIEVINYFYDPRKGKPRTYENTVQPCQLTGGWEIIEKDPNSYAYGNFYSSRWDWREVISPKESITKYNSKSVGGTTHIAADHFFAMCISATAVGYFFVTSKHKSVEGRSINVSVALPINDRCGAYMTHHESIRSVDEYEGGGTESVWGSTSDHYVLYNFVFHWVGRCGFSVAGAKCIAKYVTTTTNNSCYEATPGSFFYMVCPEAVFAGTTITVAASWGTSILGSVNYPSITPPSSWSSTKRLKEPSQSFMTWFVNDSDHGAFKVRSETVTGKDPATEKDVDIFSLNLSSWWWRASPDPDSGVVCHIFSNHSCLGSNILNYQDDIEGNVLHKGGPSYMEGSQFVCYTGVID